MNTAIDKFFVNEFSKGFYISLISWNYKIFIAAFSITAPISKRIDTIENYFLPGEFATNIFPFINYFFPAHIYKFLFATINLIIIPTLISLGVFWFVGWCQVRWNRIKKKNELNEDTQKEINKDFTGAIEALVDSHNNIKARLVSLNSVLNDPRLKNGRGLFSDFYLSKLRESNGIENEKMAPVELERMASTFNGEILETRRALKGDTSKENIDIINKLKHKI